MSRYKPLDFDGHGLSMAKLKRFPKSGLHGNALQMKNDLEFLEDKEKKEDEKYFRKLSRRLRKKVSFGKLHNKIPKIPRKKISSKKLKRLQNKYKPLFRFGFPNAVAAPYFGSELPFQNAPEFWYPVTNGAYQSPDMLETLPPA